MEIINKPNSQEYGRVRLEDNTIVDAFYVSVKGDPTDMEDFLIFSTPKEIFVFNNNLDNGLGFVYVPPGSKLSSGRRLPKDEHEFLVTTNYDVGFFDFIQSAGTKSFKKLLETRRTTIDELETAEQKMGFIDQEIRNSMGSRRVTSVFPDFNVQMIREKKTYDEFEKLTKALMQIGEQSMRPIGVNCNNMKSVLEDDFRVKNSESLLQINDLKTKIDQNQNLFSKEKSELQKTIEKSNLFLMEMETTNKNLQKKYDETTLEKNDLQKKYDDSVNMFANEKSFLKSSLSQTMSEKQACNLEKNGLQSKYDEITIEKNGLQSKYDESVSNCTIEKNGLQSRYDESVSNCTIEKNGLQSRYDESVSNCTIEKNGLQKQFENETQKLKKTYENEIKKIKQDLQRCKNPVKMNFGVGKNNNKNITVKVFLGILLLLALIYSLWNYKIYMKKNNF